ncbi:hypothetical protein BJV74DRAFT_900778 [Russula compacta]|nr:hypothetical protein BJV74DRAFT_900778 [Russula compacta]
MLTNQHIMVKLKNDLSIMGTLKSVFKYRLDAIEVLDQARHPHMVCLTSYGSKNCFICGSIV